MTALSCALGFRVKSGWAAVVLLGGSRKAPRVLDSRVVALSDPAVRHSRQPYHAAFGTAQTDKRAVDRLIRGIERFSRGKIAALVEATRDEHRLSGAGVVVSSLTDPATIANQHMRAHGSEGRLFRTVTADGLERCGVKTRIVLERDIYEDLAKRLRLPMVRVKTLVSDLGEHITSWRAEQKVAAAAAWLVLAG
jgi:hypothetical protein